MKALAPRFFDILDAADATDVQIVAGTLEFCPNPPPPQALPHDDFDLITLQEVNTIAFKFSGTDFRSAKIRQHGDGFHQTLGN